MAKNYNWRIKREYYQLINKGIKTLEVRVGYPDIKRVQKGDTITFKDYSNIKFEVIRITRYQDFPDMLDNEDSSKAIPGVTKYRALDMYQSIYSESKEALGVYVFELRKQTNEMRIFSLSTFTHSPQLFVKLAQSAYFVTDFICKDYPNHLKWYWTKAIPRIFNSCGEIVICTVNNNIAGVIFLKKDSIENKICTLFVVESYRGKHISTKMLEYAFKYLGTTKPLITITDYKVAMFEPIIKKYNWELTQITNRGYYNTTSREFVYNGKLSK